MNVWAMLQNTATNRFHPIMFSWSPMPGGAEISSGFERYRSRGHHTTGFDTREEAIANINESMGRVESFGASTETFDWDGVGIPAMVKFFRRLDLKSALEIAQAA